MAEEGAYCHRHQLPAAVCNCLASRGQLRAVELTVADWERLEQLADQAANSDSAPFAAQWDGTCQGCGQRWAAGDMVAWSADDAVVMHAACVHGDQA